ncbi:MAG: carboxypeptidase M32 [Ignavibacteria bacterium]|jgi:carboxypeptidase Taq
MNAEAIQKDTLSLMNTICDIGAATAVLNWDQETYMPHGGSVTRAEQISTLSTLMHKMMTDDNAKKLVDAIQQDANSKQHPLLRLFVDEYQKAVKLPEDLVKRVSKAQALGQDIWKEARSQKDFSKFASILDELLTLKREEAECRGYVENRYDALLDIYEPGATVSHLNPVFDKLRDATSIILKAIEPVKHTVHDKPMQQYFPGDAQMAFSRFIADKMGFDFSRGRMDLTAHPFCTSFTQHDVRLTTRINENDLSSCLYGVIHETGHGLYEQGFPSEYARTFAAEGASIGMHESQSLLWETIITRSEEFWEFALPHFAKQFPEQAKGLSPRDMYHAVNTIQPSLIRVEADEITYNMHIILRFEIERDLINGVLATKDIPEVWNAKMKEYLGITPPNDAMGCLQDVHWSFGGFGYFPSYTLGKLYAAMEWKKIKEDMPNVMHDIAQGEFSGILSWLRTNIHAYGKTAKPGEIIQNATGHPLSEQEFVNYAYAKVASVYGVKPG